MTVARWQIEEKRWLGRIGRPRSRRRELSLRSEIGLVELFEALNRLRWRRRVRVGEQPIAEHHATRAERVDARKDVRMFHPDAERAVAAHRVPGEAATHAVRNRSVVCIDVRDQLAGKEIL